MNTKNVYVDAIPWMKTLQCNNYFDLLPFGLQNPNNIPKKRARRKQLKPMICLMKLMTCSPPMKIAPGMLRERERRSQCKHTFPCHLIHRLPISHLWLVVVFLSGYIVEVVLTLSKEEDSDDAEN